MTDPIDLAIRTITRDPGIDPEALCDRCKVMVLGQRRPVVGKYDDLISLITPDGVRTWPGNLDPSRLGLNKAIGKNYARLTPGVYPFRTGEHKGRPNNWRQMTALEAQRLVLSRYFHDERAYGLFKVARKDKGGNGHEEWGMQNINIHTGADSSTSSWGCLTLDPDDWKVFQPAAYEALAKHKQTWPVGWMPVVIVES